MSIACLKSPRSKAFRSGPRKASPTSVTFVVASGRSTPPKAASRRARRRRIDPTTCERDYHPEELEFMQAVEQYKRSSGRMFPTCSELLEVVRSLGYVRAETC